MSGDLASSIGAVCENQRSNFRQKEGYMVETRSKTIEARRNASSTNDHGRRKTQVVRIASLEYQIQDLNRNINDKEK